jgi:O-antigen/teichoic acid export membrane protein
MTKPAISAATGTIPGDSVDPTPPVLVESVPGSPSTQGLGARIRTAVIWRSGSQIAGQMIAWAATFLVIRILSPADYGLYAMTQVLLMLFTMLNGYGLASAVIQQPEVTTRQLRQVLGLLLLVNGALALLQLLAAPLAAAYYRAPMVAELLRVQAVIYLTTPFTALAYARLGRAMEFRRQAQVNLLCSLIGAAVALGGALAGWGVWALVWAPIAMFTSRAIGLTIVSHSWMWPLFDFRGAGTMARYGGVIAIGQIFAFTMTQADVLVAGRLFDAHVVGVYTTALFLTQIFNNKVIPPLNEVAFTAYSRMQDDRRALAQAFARAARAIMTAAMPFFMGLAVVTEPLVLTLLGQKWAATAPLIRYLALAMPFWTLFTLLQPATDALGRPGIALRNAMLGALIMPVAFILGGRYGIIGIASAWLIAYPMLMVVGLWRSLPVIGLPLRDLIRAVTPPVMASLAMAAAVLALDHVLPALAPLPHLLLLVGAGALVYCGWLLLFERSVVRDLLAMLRGQPR